MFNEDPFLKQYNYTWDFVFVFHVFGEETKLDAMQREYTLKKTVRKLSK
jgi:predicted GIY-YIG superfamily endonuclease